VKSDDCLRLLKEYAGRQQTYLSLLAEVAPSPESVSMTLSMMVNEAKIDLVFAEYKFNRHFRACH
jgi:hypothetical protein